jgi:hypothetical protein
MSSSSKNGPPGFLDRRGVRLVIILAVGTALGLIFNTFNPDGIPLVKKRPTLQGK